MAEPRVGCLTVRRAAELYHCHGMTFVEVGEIAGVLGTTVWKAFERHDIPRRAPGQKEIVTREALERARRSGWTKARLARALECSDVTTVINAQKRLGFEWPERDGQYGGDHLPV